MRIQPELVTKAEIARRFDMTPMSATRWAAMKTFPAPAIDASGVKLYVWSEVLEWARTAKPHREVVQRAS